MLRIYDWTQITDIWGWKCDWGDWFNQNVQNLMILINYSKFMFS